MRKQSFSTSYYVLFHGETVQTILSEIVYFGIAFARHIVVRTSQILVERFAENRVVTKKTTSRGIFHRYVQTVGTGHLVTLSIEGIEKFKTYIELTIPKMIRSSIVPGLIVLYVLR